MADQVLDASGLNCPMPILKTKKALKGMSAGETLEVISTDAGSVKDLVAFCNQTELWDDRESLTIIGHEIMHCALSDHRDVIINETAEVDTTEKEVLGDIEDLYAQDRLLELEWLKEDYAEMGIVVD